MAEGKATWLHGGCFKEPVPEEVPSRFEMQDTLAGCPVLVSLEMETLKQFHSRSAHFSRGAGFIT